MKARRFPILSRNRGHAATPSSLTEFELGEGEDWDAADVLESATWSLFCFHVEQNEAVFVQTPEDVDLLAAPFFYAAQFEHAHHVLKVPLIDLPKLTENLVLRDDQLIWIHSVGRCGSTLLSKALSTCENVWSLSEPDVLLDVCELKSSGKLHEEDYLDVVSATVALTCKDALSSAGRLVIKPRSQVSELMLDIQEVFPRCQQLFMTRSPLSWIRSVFSAYMRDYNPDDLEGRRGFERTTAKWIPMLLDEADPKAPMSYPKLWALNFICAQQKWEEMGKRALPDFLLTYETIKQDPEREFRHLFEALNLSIDESKLREVLARDSQEGTALAQGAEGRDSYEMRPEDREEARAVFAKFGLI